MKIIFTDAQILEMPKNPKTGLPETTRDNAKEAMRLADISFDDIERILDHYEEHRWGSDADRRYRKSAVAKAVARVASDPTRYARV